MQHGGDACAQRSEGVCLEQLGQDVQSTMGQEVALRVGKVAQQRGQSKENLRESNKSQKLTADGAAWTSTVIFIIYLFLHPKWL